MSTQNSGPLTDSYGMVAGDVSDLRKSVPIAWPEAQRICDIAEVRELIDAFAEYSHEENMWAMVSAIMGHAVAQGRAAGLEEERAAFEQWFAADTIPGSQGFFSRDQSNPDEYSIFEVQCEWRAWQARAALSPTSSDAGKDDAEPGGRHYRKKPVVIEAVQFTEALRDAHLFDGASLPVGVTIPRKWLHRPSRKVYSADAFIETLEGRMAVSLNDWIITGIKGEFYPCKPDIFAATYEPVAALSSLEVIGKGEKG